MKILHLCLGNYFAEGYSYQENNLTRQHKAMGYDVEVIASIQSFDKNGMVSYNEKVGTYINSDGIKVTRLPYIANIALFRILKKYKGVYLNLAKSGPDIIFIHNFQFLDINSVISFLKENPKTIVYIDSHADFSNSARRFLSRVILHKILWKHLAKKIEPYARKFYGTLPARVDFLKNVYSLPDNKCELLIMGADDALISKAKQSDARKMIRKLYNISDDDFLLVTGGKIDIWKEQTLLLMRAVHNIKNSHLKLIIFGSVAKELMDSFLSLVDGHNVQYIGWLKSDQTYPIFEAADLAIFPGRHSVLWEQAAGQGLPMIVKKWQGTTHINFNGNAVFLNNDSESDIQKMILSFIDNPEKYNKILLAAKEAKDHFSYKQIAKRAIELT